MQKRYRLGQFLRYIVPGAMILLFAGHFTYTVLKLTEVNISLDKLDLLQLQIPLLLLFLLLSYFLGHFVQAYGLIKERRQDPRGWWFYSLRYLHDPQADCSQALQERLRTAIEKDFNLAVTEGEGDEAEKLHRDIYHLYHSTLIQAGKNQQPEVYRELDTFNHAAAAVCKVGFLFFVAEALWYLIYLGWNLSHQLSVLPMAIPAQVDLILGFLISLILGMILLKGAEFFEQRYERTARGLVEMVFKNYYVHHLETKR